MHPRSHETCQQTGVGGKFPRDRRSTVPPGVREAFHSLGILGNSRGKISLRGARALPARSSWEGWRFYYR